MLELWGLLELLCGLLELLELALLEALELLELLEEVLSTGSEELVSGCETSDDVEEVLSTGCSEVLADDDVVVDDDVEVSTLRSPLTGTLLLPPFLVAKKTISTPITTNIDTIVTIADTGRTPNTSLGSLGFALLGGT